MYYKLTPAYGRDYKTKAEVIAAFESGKDFEGDYTHSFQLVNIDAFQVGDVCNLRYKSNRAVTPFRVGGKV